MLICDGPLYYYICSLKFVCEIKDRFLSGLAGIIPRPGVEDLYKDALLPGGGTYGCFRFALVQAAFY
jgi:hypothetical protein